MFVSIGTLGKVISECIKTSLDQFSNFLLNKLKLTKPNENRSIAESFDWSDNRDIVVGALSKYMFWVGW